MAEWILPSNPKYYRLDDAFRELVTVDWSQNSTSKNVKTGDTVYIYYSSPVSAIRWVCTVLESHKNPCTIDDGAYAIPPETRSYPIYEDCIVLHAERELDAGPLLDYKHMARHGLKSTLMGAYQLKDSPLLDYIHAVVGTPDLSAMLGEDAEHADADTLKALAKKASGRPVKQSTSQVTQYFRDPYIAEYAKLRANGKCQLCGKAAPFLDRNGKPYLESHHIEWLSAGGDDSIKNTAALCPDCHRKMHILALPEDVKKLKAANEKLK